MSITLISTVTVGSGGVANIDFTSISGSFTDLMILISARSASSANAYSEIGMYFNGASYPDATASFRTLEGTGSSVASNSVTTYLSAGWANGSGTTANSFSNNTIYIPNYAGSAQKSYSKDSVIENNATAGYQHMVAGKSTITAAITSIRLNAESTYAIGSTATLYGVLKGSSGGVTVS